MNTDAQIDESSFLLFAAKFYDNSHCLDTQEFFDDIKRFKYLKRLFNKYQETGELKERLILNHIVILNNTFSPPIATRMLFFKLRGFEEYLKPFLILLGTLPDKVTGIGKDNATIYTTDIKINRDIVKVLREI
jgi:hypothetical protein